MVQNELREILMGHSAVYYEIGQSSAICDPQRPNPIDLQHLRRYTLGDVGLEREVLELFLHQLPQTIASLRSACTQKDWKIAAHTLKGSGRAVGAWRIARIAEEAEREPAVDNPVRITQTVKLLEAAAKEAKDFVAATYG